MFDRKCLLRESIPETGGSPHFTYNRIGKGFRVLPTNVALGAGSFVGFESWVGEQ
jgi:hypothetical protein